ncbi:hypothetical protein HK102_003174 [Quaeritorhiza haematococci]|nr:hypothetical protein HK102_003174 [Quaeritorhiza haematococci]
MASRSLLSFATRFIPLALCASSLLPAASSTPRALPLKVDSPTTASESLQTFLELVGTILDSSGIGNFHADLVKRSPRPLETNAFEQPIWDASPSSTKNGVSTECASTLTDVYNNLWEACVPANATWESEQDFFNKFGGVVDHLCGKQACYNLPGAWVKKVRKACDGPVQLPVGQTYIEVEPASLLVVLGSAIGPESQLCSLNDPSDGSFCVVDFFQSIVNSAEKANAIFEKSDGECGYDCWKSLSTDLCTSCNHDIFEFASDVLLSLKPTQLAVVDGILSKLIGSELDTVSIIALFKNISDMFCGSLFAPVDIIFARRMQALRRLAKREILASETVTSLVTSYTATATATIADFTLSTIASTSWDYAPTGTYEAEILVATTLPVLIGDIPMATQYVDIFTVDPLTNGGKSLSISVLSSVDPTTTLALSTSTAVSATTGSTTEASSVFVESTLIATTTFLPLETTTSALTLDASSSSTVTVLSTESAATTIVSAIPTEGDFATSTAIPITTTTEGDSTSSTEAAPTATSTSVQTAISATTTEDEWASVTAYVTATETVVNLDRRDADDYFTVASETTQTTTASSAESVVFTGLPTESASTTKAATTTSAESAVFTGLPTESAATTKAATTTSAESVVFTDLPTESALTTKAVTTTTDEEEDYFTIWYETATATTTEVTSTAGFIASTTLSGAKSETTASVVEAFATATEVFTAASATETFASFSEFTFAPADQTPTTTVDSSFVPTEETATSTYESIFAPAEETATSAYDSTFAPAEETATSTYESTFAPAEQTATTYYESTFAPAQQSTTIAFEISTPAVFDSTVTAVTVTKTVTEGTIEPSQLSSAVQDYLKSLFSHTHTPTPYPFTTGQPLTQLLKDIQSGTLSAASTAFATATSSPSRFGFTMPAKMNKDRTSSESSTGYTATLTLPTSSVAETGSAQPTFTLRRRARW